MIFYLLVVLIVEDPGPNGIHINMNLGILTSISPTTYSVGAALSLNESRYQSLFPVWFRDFIVSYELTYELWSEYRTSKQKETYITPFKLDNIFVHKVGIEYGYQGLYFFRLGYIYRRTPVSDTILETDINLLDTDRNVVTMGLGVRMPPILIVAAPITLDFSLQHHLLTRREVVKEDQTVIDKNFYFGGSITQIALTFGTSF